MWVAAALIVAGLALLVFIYWQWKAEDPVVTYRKGTDDED